MQILANNNTNTLGFSAFSYDKQVVAQMPKRFQKAFNKALPEIEKRSKNFDSTLAIEFRDNKVHCARFDIDNITTVVKNDTCFFLNCKNKDGSPKGYIDILKAKPKKIIETFRKSVKEAKENKRRNLQDLINFIYPTKENRDYMRAVRREINFLTKTGEGLPEKPKNV